LSPSRKHTNNYKTISFEISHKKSFHPEDPAFVSPRHDGKSRKVLSKIVKIELYKDANAEEEFDENFKIIASKVRPGHRRRKPRRTSRSCR